MKSLLRAGLGRREVIRALRLLAWMMRLPKAEALQLRQKVLELDEMKETLPLTDWEEILIEENKDQWLQEGLEKGLEQGLQRGRQEGRQEGREQGEWVGKVSLLESLLGYEPTPVEVLEAESVAELKARFERLEREYHSRHRTA